MKTDPASAVADTVPGIDGSELESLLVLFERITRPKAAAMLRRRLCHQVLRAAEVGILADPAVLDIALNPGIYLGREAIVLEARLQGLLGGEPPSSLVQHFRALVMSGAAGSGQKAPARSFDEDVFSTYRLTSEQLRCLDCGYHFLEADLGQARLEKATRCGFEFAAQQLARRLRDPWKPATESGLSIDHLIPEAGLGPTEPENLRIVCIFCNKRKQIYRWPGEANGRDVASALLALGSQERGIWAPQATTYTAIAYSGGVCSQCEQTIKEVELTARPLGGREVAATPPWEMEAVCYACYDPAG